MSEAPVSSDSTRELINFHELPFRDSGEDNLSNPVSGPK